MATATKIPWACPKCGTPAPGMWRTGGGHGKGGANQCQYTQGRSGTCYGFVCDCAEDVDSAHGDTHNDPCPNATCYHCGWTGTFPPPPFDPKKLKGWARTAWAARWRPPVGWRP